MPNDSGGQFPLPANTAPAVGGTPLTSPEEVKLTDDVAPDLTTPPATAPISTPETEPTPPPPALPPSSPSSCFSFPWPPLPPLISSTNKTAFSANSWPKSRKLWLNNASRKIKSRLPRRQPPSPSSLPSALFPLLPALLLPPLPKM